MDPKAALLWNGLGVVLDLQEKYDESIEAYQKAIELDPEYLYPWHNLGIVLERKGDIKGAINSFKKALEIDPNFEGSQINLERLEKSGNSDQDERKSLNESRQNAQEPD